MDSAPEKTIFDSDARVPIEQSRKAWSQRPILMLFDGAVKITHRFPIDKRDIIVGRDAMCDLALNDGKASRRHATLIYENFDHAGEEPRILLRDLNSTNGTFVNGVRVTEHYLKDRDRVMIGSSQFGYFLRDESELEAEQKLLEMASYDALTKLFNRGVFNVHIQREFERSRRYARDMSLVMLDIDHFKDLNDSHGHQAGDFVLQELARIIQANVRGNDSAARYGGEEFSIILPETSIVGAAIQADRLRREVEEKIFQLEGQDVHVTISIGVAASEKNMKQVEQLIKAADMALYQAKGHGRNRVCIFRDGRVQEPDATC